LAGSEETLVSQYKEAYGDNVAEEKLKEYVYYQKLIHEAKTSKKGKRGGAAMGKVVYEEVVQDAQ
jgi:hypothetical protein